MRSSNLRRVGWLLFAGVVVAAAFIATSRLGLIGSTGPLQSPLGDFKAVGTSQLEELQIKLTWGGPQRKAVSTAGFTSSAGSYDASRFGPFERRVDSFYVNDPDFDFPECSASTSELQDMISDVNALPITDLGGFGLDMPDGMLSFMLVTSETGNPSKDMGFEAILDESAAETLLLTVAKAAESCLAPLQRLWLSVGFPIDFDGDGCTDAQELGANEALGGLRDPTNPWDYFDPAGAGGGPPDGYVDLANDILGVRGC